jgi:hypothetical protein
MTNLQKRFDTYFTDQEKMVLSNYLDYLAGTSKDLLEAIIDKSTFEKNYSSRFKNWLYGIDGSSTIELSKLSRDAWPEHKSIDFFNAWAEIDSSSANYGSVIDFSKGFEKDSEKKYMSIMTSFDLLPSNADVKEAKRIFGFFASENAPLIKVGFTELLKSGKARPFVDLITATFHVSKSDLQEQVVIANKIQMAIDTSGSYSIANQLSSFSAQEQHVIKNIERYINSRASWINSKPLFNHVLNRTNVDTQFAEKFKDWLYWHNGASTTVIRELCREIWNEMTPYPTSQSPTDFNNAWMPVDSAMAKYGGAIEFVGDLTEVDESLYLDLVKSLSERPKSTSNDVYQLFCFYASKCQRHLEQPELKSNLHRLFTNLDAQQFSEDILKVIYVEEYQREDFKEMIAEVGHILHDLSDYPIYDNPK